MPVIAIETSRATVYKPVLPAMGFLRSLRVGERSDDGSAYSVSLDIQGTHSVLRRQSLDAGMRFWLGAAEPLLRFWDNEIDAQYDSL
jgi:hypothetical protein